LIFVGVVFPLYVKQQKNEELTALKFICLKLIQYLICQR